MYSRSLEPVLSSRVGLYLADGLSNDTVAADTAKSVREEKSSRSTLVGYNCTRDLEGAVFGDRHTFSWQGDPFRVWFVQMPPASVLFRQDATFIFAFADRFVLPHAARTSTFLILVGWLHIDALLHLD